MPRTVLIGSKDVCNVCFLVLFEQCIVTYITSKNIHIVHSYCNFYYANNVGKAAAPAKQLKRNLTHYRSENTLHTFI